MGQAFKQARDQAKCDKLHMCPPPPHTHTESEEGQMEQLKLLKIVWVLTVIEVEIVLGAKS